MADVGGLLLRCQKQPRLLPAAKQSFTLKLCFVILYILCFFIVLFSFSLASCLQLEVKVSVHVMEHLLRNS